MVVKNIHGDEFYGIESVKETPTKQTKGHSVIFTMYGIFYPLHLP